MCIDYHSLNRQTRLDVFPTPHIADLFDRLGKATIFVTLCMLVSGQNHRYHQNLGLFRFGESRSLSPDKRL